MALLDGFLLNSCCEGVEKEPGVCSELRNLFGEYGGVEKMDE